MRLVKRFFVLIACIMFWVIGATAHAVTIETVNENEDIFQYIQKIKGGFDQTFYQKK